jgi:hypothetical protein
MTAHSAVQIWTGVLAAASALVLLCNAAERLGRAWQAAKAPNDRQNARISSLEAWKVEVDRKLNQDKQQLDEIHDGLRASYQAQLALLDHGIDGNNLEQMQHAKEVLQRHLINR